MRTLAFYLPQYHPIAENDEWWQPGFTDWVNVRRARPQYQDHGQPRRAGLLGEYDLTDPEVRIAQTRLARSHSVDGFCVYYYWFNGKRLLEEPLEAWRESAQLLPYCISWANESWTRRWDGKSRHILIQQRYARGFAESLFRDVLPHFRAPHYLRQDGAPILVVHRATEIPHPREVATVWRRRARAEGFRDLYLIAAETVHGMDPRTLGFDAVVEFPPVGANDLRTALLRPVSGISSDFRGRLLSYDRLLGMYCARQRPRFVRHRGVAPGWDNTPRRGANATIYVGATPEKYGKWLGEAREWEDSERGERGLVFINAWNEWAEGAYLEPDAGYGMAYLEATAGRIPRIVNSPCAHDAKRRARRYSYPQAYGTLLCAAGSVARLQREIQQAVATWLVRSEASYEER